MTNVSVSRSFHFVSMQRSTSFLVSTPIGKETGTKKNLKTPGNIKDCGAFLQETSGNESLFFRVFVSSQVLVFTQISFPAVSTSEA